MAPVSRPYRADVVVPCYDEEAILPRSIDRLDALARPSRSRRKFVV